jgi:predicted amidophosphoribosyltransferase
VPLLVREVLEAVLPQRCVVCGRFGGALHDGCIEALPAADGVRCPRCWSPLDGRCERCTAMPRAFEALRARFRFDGAARRALLEAKFRGVTALLAPLALAATEAVPDGWGIDAVAPVPLHGSRQRRRGYNQAALISKAVAAHLGVPHRADLVWRTRATRPQAGLSREARLRNLQGAFSARPVAGSVLLVDDVTTTGATFEATVLALLDAGATRVYALAVARED